MAYRVWVLPDNEFKNREYVESAGGPTQAKPVMDYLKARLPEKDTVAGDWGEQPGPEVPRLDPHRLQEPQNDWADEQMPTPGRPIVLDR